MANAFVIFSRAFAPYRFEFYEGLRVSEFPELPLILAEEVPQDHPWQRNPAEIFKGRLRVTGLGIAGCRRIWIELSGSNPSLLLVTEYTVYATVAMIWAKCHAVPFVIATDAGLNVPPHARRWYSPWWHSLWRRASHGIIGCTRDAELCGLAMGKPTFFAPHAANSGRFVPKRPDNIPSPVIFLCVGRLIEKKGLLDLVEAGLRLSESSPVPFLVRMVGDGPLRGHLEQEAATCDWLEVRPFSEGDQLVREYQDADVFILPSHEDTYAVVVHEAACCGLPLIVSEAAGACEVLVEGKRTGLSVPPRSPVALAAAMKRMLEDEIYRAGCSDRAREVGERYSVDYLARDCGAWLRKLMENQDC